MQNVVFIDDKAPSTFWIKDFPLARKTSLWQNFPTNAIITPSPFSLPTPAPLVYPEIASISYTPNFATWEKQIEKFKKSKVLEKVVLSRIKTITYRSKIDPFMIYNHLRKTCKNATPFLFLLNEEEAFLGATPELLYKKNHLFIETEALAGTAVISQKEALLRSEKDIEEFLIVKKAIHEMLQKISHPFPFDEKFFLKETHSLCHLHYPFKAILKEPIKDETLVEMLHPTPAIGGSPREEALSFIFDTETHDRGYFCGTLANITDKHSQVYVGIRSSLIQKNKMHIFTGAGIVKNSNAKSEWEELENKTRLFT